MGTKALHNTHTTCRHLHKSRPCKLLLGFTGQISLDLAVQGINPTCVSAGAGLWPCTSPVACARADQTQTPPAGTNTLMAIQKQRAIGREEASLCPGKIRLGCGAIHVGSWSDGTQCACSMGWVALPMARLRPWGSSQSSQRAQGKGEGLTGASQHAQAGTDTQMSRAD